MFMRLLIFGVVAQCQATQTMKASFFKIVVRGASVGRVDCCCLFLAVLERILQQLLWQL
jgi:hypothetical protein